MIRAETGKVIIMVMDTEGRSLGGTEERENRQTPKCRALTQIQHENKFLLVLVENPTLGAALRR